MNEVCLRLYILTKKVSLSKIWKSSPLFWQQTRRLFEPEFVFIINFLKNKLQVAVLLTFIICSVINLSVPHISQQCTAHDLNTNRTVWVGLRLYYSYE